MNKNLLIAIGIVILTIIVAGGGMFVLNQQGKTSEDATMKKDETSTVKQEESADDAMMKKGSRYIEYSKANLDQTAGGRRVLYFYANWCPICRPTDANLKQNVSQIPQDLTVIRVNYNDPDTDQEEKDLSKKYGIVYQHTFVQIDSQGKEITKWSGGQIEELLANIK